MAKQKKKSAAEPPNPWEVCQNRKCKCCGELLVERGYGYPVCPSTPRREYA